jgi:hypothetical protein
LRPHGLCVRAMPARCMGWSVLAGSAGTNQALPTCPRVPVPSCSRARVPPARAPARCAPCALRVVRPSPSSASSFFPSAPCSYLVLTLFLPCSYLVLTREGAFAPSFLLGRGRSHPRFPRFVRPRAPYRGPLLEPARDSFHPARTVTRIGRSGTVFNLFWPKPSLFWPTRIWPVWPVWPKPIWPVWA